MARTVEKSGGAAAPDELDEERREIRQVAYSEILRALKGRPAAPDEAVKIAQCMKELGLI